MPLLHNHPSAPPMTFDAASVGCWRSLTRANNLIAIWIFSKGVGHEQAHTTLNLTSQFLHSVKAIWR